MKKVLVALIFGLVFTTACDQKSIPLKQGMSNTITLSNGEVIYDLNGKWDAIYDSTHPDYEENKWIVEITQQDNEFVGIKLVQTSGKGKETETIKGKLEKNGFKSLKMLTTYAGWQKGKFKIDENCNKLELKTKLYGHTFSINLTRI